MAKCFGMDTNHILIAMAEKAEYLKVMCIQYFSNKLEIYCLVIIIFEQDIDLALSIYQQLPPPTSERESALLIAR